MTTTINPQADKQRKIFRRVGWILLVIGFVFIIIGNMESAREFNDFGRKAQQRLVQFEEQGTEKLEAFRAKSLEEFNAFKEDPSSISSENIKDLFDKGNKIKKDLLLEDEIYLTWLRPLGILLLFGGIVNLLLGYMGVLFRYKMGEMVSVSKDTIKVLKPDVKEVVTELSTAVFSGMNSTTTIEQRLKELDVLKEKGLITVEEYRSKRLEILDTL
jgi:hypothetical protein